MKNKERIKNKVQNKKGNQNKNVRNKNVIRRQISSNNFKYAKLENNSQNKNKNKNIKQRDIKGYKEPEDIKKEKINVKTILAVLIIIALIFVILYRESILDIKAKEIKSLKESNKKIEKENSQIELSFQSALSLNNIEKSASEKLGMKKQSKDNTVYLKIDVEDFIEPVVVTKIEREDNNFFKKIYNNILDFFGSKGQEQSNIKIKENEEKEKDPEKKDSKEESKEEKQEQKTEKKPEEQK